MGGAGFASRLVAMRFDDIYGQLPGGKVGVAAVVVFVAVVAEVFGVGGVVPTGGTAAARTTVERGGSLGERQ